MTAEQFAISAEEFPLIDQNVMADWSGDLDKSDVLDLLSRVPAESYRSLTAIKQSAADGDLAAAKRAAHCLKGMASNLGATRLARLARAIEINSGSTDEVLTQSQALEHTLVETLEHLHSFGAE